MLGLSECEMLFYGGIIIVATAVLLGGMCTILFILTGRKIKQKLEQDYGKLEK